MQKVRLLIMFLLIALFIAVGAVAAQPSNFRAHLVGSEENPPVDTTATGQVVFRLDAGGSSLHYTLIVANIEDVFASHIHCGPVGVNGPVGVTLFAGSTVTVNGILAKGTITTPNPGNACGWADLADVAAALQSGDTYVNVHTTANPGGEIRGQVH
jgi:hypothetical protein